MSEKVGSAVIENAKSELAELLDAIRIGQVNFDVPHGPLTMANARGFPTIGDYLRNLLDIIPSGETITLR